MKFGEICDVANYLGSDPRAPRGAYERFAITMRWRLHSALHGEYGIALLRPPLARWACIEPGRPWRLAA
jgi:hypothetical protein